MKDLATKSAITCEKCNSHYEAAALLLGTTPGYTCGCEWSSMTRREFRVMFGFSFYTFKRALDKQTKSSCLVRSDYVGNSHQRRTQRRVSIQASQHERARLAAEEQ